MYVCVSHPCLGRSEKGISLRPGPGVKVIVSPCGCWESNLGLLQDQGLSPGDTSLQPLLQTYDATILDAKNSGLFLSCTAKLSTVADICNASIWDMEGGGGPGVPDHPQQQDDFQGHPPN